MRSTLALFLIAVVSTACSAGSHSSFGPYTALRVRSPGSPAARYLYAASPSCSPYPSGCVLEYALGSAVPLRTIVIGISNPTGIALDRAGNLYVANHLASTVTVYAPGFSTPFRTIKKGIASPFAVAVNQAGNLVVANLPDRSGDESDGSVTVYAPNGSTPVRTITTGIDAPQALAFDASGNLFVANLFSGNGEEGTIAEFAQGSTKPLRVLVNGIHVPFALLFNPAGKLYVANHAWSYSVYHPEGKGDVAVFGTRGSKPVRKISEQVTNPTAIAMDSRGTLYVASGYGDYGITEYAAGSKTPSLAIPGVSANSLLVDGNDNLYVGDDNSVAIYAPRSTTPAMTIARGGVALALGSL